MDARERTWTISLTVLVGSVLGFSALGSALTGPDERIQVLRERHHNVASKLAHRQGRCPAYNGSWHPVAGDISNDPEPVGGGSIDYFEPNSAWFVGDHCLTTDVTTGVLVAEGLEGTGAIFVNRSVPGRSWLTKSTGSNITIPGSGTIQITDAPLGRSAIRGGGLVGDVYFSSSSGLSGTLHMEDCSVTFDAPLPPAGVKGDSCSGDAAIIEPELIHN